jgi:hypothetical protein
MAVYTHGKHTIVTVDTDPIVDCNTSELSLEADEHDNTVYEDDDEVPEGGILRGTFTMGGLYKAGATGTVTLLPPLLGTTIVITVKPEGTGTGLPLHTFSGLLKKFVTTRPVAGYQTWSAEFKKSGALVTTAQA